MNVAAFCRLYVLRTWCSDPSKCAISSCTDIPSDPLKCACESSSRPLFCALIYSYKGSFPFLTCSLDQKSKVNSDPLFCACLKLSSTDLNEGSIPSFCAFQNEVRPLNLVQSVSRLKRGSSAPFSDAFRPLFLCMHAANFQNSKGRPHWKIAIQPIDSYAYNCSSVWR